MSSIGKSTHTQKKVSGCQRLGEKGQKVTANGYRVSFGGDENVLILDSYDCCITL